MRIVERIVNSVKEQMGDNYEINLVEIGKNNGVVCQAITIRERGGKIAPTIHIDSLLEKTESEEISVQEAAAEITSVYRKQDDFEKYMDISKCINKEYALEKVAYQIVNKENNADMLNGIPHKEFLDLAVIYRVIIKEENDECLSMAITNDFCEAYSISKDELDSAAWKNTEERSFIVCPISSLFMDISSVPENNGELPMWVFTNPSNFNGASVMLYKDYFNGLANQLKSDLYILPSSIHEVIAVPVNNSQLDFLKRTVYEINATTVAAEEVLSNNVYRYSRANGRLSIA